MRTLLRILGIFFGIGIVLAVGVMAFYFFYPNAPQTTTQDLDQVALSEKGIYHILLAGLDEEKTNTDTLLLVQFHAETKEARILSIPRDTMSNVYDREVQRINAAYNVIEPPDIDRTIEEVEMLTSLNIDRYVLTSFTAVEEIIDALGGIKIDVPHDMIYEDPYQDLSINIRQGRQTLDGEEAVHFLRYRSGYMEGDLGRVKTQQLFFQAFFDTLLEPSSLTKVPDLVQIINDETETDMTAAEMLWFAKQAKDMDTKDSLSLFILPGRAEYINEISYYIPSLTNLLEMLNKEFNPLDKAITAKDLNLVPYAAEVIADTGYGTENTGLREFDHTEGLGPSPFAGGEDWASYPYTSGHQPTYTEPTPYSPPSPANSGPTPSQSEPQPAPSPAPAPAPAPAPQPPMAQPVDPPPYY